MHSSGDPVDPSLDPRHTSLGEELGRQRLLSRLFGDDAPAAKVARFTLLDRVGEGGMGTVWSAYDPQLDRRVAVKLLHGGTHDDRESTRVLREARIMASINHPNVAQVYEVGAEAGRIFIAMEFVQGSTLRAWVRERERSWQAIVAMYVQAGRGLAAAHRQGVVHRDFKPDNALVGADERVRVVDFGLACTDAAALVTDGTSPTSGAGATMDGASRKPAGTPAYMAPEQIRGRDVDGRSDQFALCVALFEALSGARPFAGESVVLLLQEIERGEPPLRRLPARVPAHVRQVLARGLSPDPAERYPSIDHLLEALERDPRRRLRRVALMGTFGALVLTAAVLGRATATADPDPCPDPSDRIAGIWDDARRHAIATALQRAAPSFGTAAADGVAHMLDAYAGAWTDGYRDACMATHVRHAQSERLLDARVQCLEDRRVALASIVDTLADADATVAEHAIRAAASLPSVDRCADARYVQSAIPPPDDPAIAEAVDEQSHELARARALLHAGRPDAARAIAAVVLPRARALDHPPLLAKAEYVHGSALAGGADIHEGEEHLVQAYALARRVSDGETAGWAAANLAHTLARHTTRRDQAKAWATVAQIEGTLLDDASMQAHARNAYGIAMILADDRVAAGIAFREAVELAQRSSAVHALAYRSNLGRYLTAAGEIEEAAAMHEVVVREAEAALGPDHPALIGYIDALADPWLILERAADLEPLVERAAALALTVRGEAHPDTARILSVLGHCELRLGKLEQARAHLQHAIAVSDAMRAGGAEQATMGLQRLAEVHFALDEPEPAIDLLRRAVQEVDRFGGGPGRDAAVARSELASGLLRAGQPAEALVQSEDAIAMFEQVLGPDHLDLSQARQVRAEALAAVGRSDEAVADLDRAIAIRLRTFDESSPKLADLRLTQAEIALKRGEAETAIAAAERALALIEGITLPPAEIASAKLVLARALVAARRDIDRAGALAQDAITTLQRGSPADRRRADEAATWMRQP